MKKTILTLILLCFSISYSQKSNDYVKSGIAKQFQKKYKEAFNDFQKAIQLDPKNAKAYFLKAQICYKVITPETARMINMKLSDLNTAIELNPNYVEAYLSRGIEKYDLEDYQGAISDYTKAIEIDKKNFDCYAYRGIAKTKLNDNNGALADYNKAIEINPKYAFCYGIRGVLKYNLGLKEEACLDFSKAGELGNKLSNDYIKQYCN